MPPTHPYRDAASITQVRTQDICWYLDATFCYRFFSMNEDGTDVVLVLRLHLSPHPPPRHTPFFDNPSSAPHASVHRSLPASLHRSLLL